MVTFIQGTFPPTSMEQQPLVGQRLHIIEASRSHSDIATSLGLLLTSDQTVAETSSRQHTTLARDRHQCPRGIRTRDPSKREAVDPLGSAQDIYSML